MENATLTYTGENRQFAFTDGQFKTTGNKVINDGKFVRVDGAQICKDEAFVGSYNYVVENGVMKNLWLNVNDPADVTDILGQINACFSSLNTENE